MANVSSSDPAEPAESDSEQQPRELSPAATRALAEAEARRQAQKAADAAPPAELGGQAGPDPVRYGDWEKAGIVSDF